MTENKYLADGPLVVAIDSSTTSTKAIVVDAEGNIWHTAKQNIQLHTPAMDQYEHNPIRWWETSRATIGEVLSKLSPTDRSRIAAIGITPPARILRPLRQGRPTAPKRHPVARRPRHRANPPLRQRTHQRALRKASRRHPRHLQDGLGQGTRTRDLR